ncbi:hypothetical protein CAter282_2108 [Collimonas arenae]|uniref:Uncharacterized protein n=1 Tax=Collimonas arenae TaxID=279058 RepID=A0A127PRI8_9BURK|nr:hypothetical protein CAter10_2290 [Collimonas arenae]AMP09866.1 hypothetical protein CAter282_2108 [Collimonas arenae]
MTVENLQVVFNWLLSLRRKNNFLAELIKESDAWFVNPAKRPHLRPDLSWRFMRGPAKNRRCGFTVDKALHKRILCL